MHTHQNISNSPAMRGQVYCPVSRRTEGTRNMAGERCSYCGKNLTEKA